MLQRIYGTAWATEDELKEYLHRLEEAEKRDHRKLGREMDLFHFQEEAPGSVFWHAKGWTLFQTLIAYMRRRLDAAGYNEVNSPDMMEKHFWELSGHWENYHEMMFVTELPDERVFCCKPMNCPGHVQIFKHGLKSYRDLPLKIGEFGKVHRYEPSGAMHGLLRVRHFTQDDAHIFITEEQLAEQCLEVNDLLLSIYEDFGFKDIVVKLSTRPEKRVGTDEQWDHAEAIMAKVLDEIEKRGKGRIKTAINPGEGAFYGPKFEYVLKDAIGRDWQCGTTQVDFNLPGRLGAFYIDEHSEKKTPVMIHRAIFGSLERFTGVLIENFAGHFPLWLAPLQVVVATIVSDADAYALDVAAQAARGGPARRHRSPQREDQLQGARALAGQGAGDAGRRQARGGGGQGLDPPHGLARSDGHAARRGDRGSRRRGHPAGLEAGGADGRQSCVASPRKGFTRGSLLGSGPRRAAVLAAPNWRPVARHLSAASESDIQRHPF